MGIPPRCLTGKEKEANEDALGIRHLNTTAEEDTTGDIVFQAIRVYVSIFKAECKSLTYIDGTKAKSIQQSSHQYAAYEAEQR